MSQFEPAREQECSLAGAGWLPSQQDGLHVSLQSPEGRFWMGDLPPQRQSARFHEKEMRPQRPGEM